jgi:hypothetical protein
LHLGNRAIEDADNPIIPDQDNEVNSHTISRQSMV